MLGGLKYDEVSQMVKDPQARSASTETSGKVCPASNKNKDVSTKDGRWMANTSITRTDAEVSLIAKYFGGSLQ